MNTESRPRITLPFTTTDRVLEVTGWSLVLIVWIVTVMYYAGLPQIIPVHFDAKGQPDGYGEKYMILLIPFIATVLCAALTWLCRYPHLFNYPSPITATTAAKQYALATRMLRCLKIIIAAIFLFMTTHTISSATGHTSAAGL